VLTHVFDRVQRLPWPAQYAGRALRNSFTDEWHHRTEELEEDEAAAERYQEARAGRDYDRAVIYAGQAVGLVKHERTAREVVVEIGESAEALLRARCTGLLDYNSQPHGGTHD